MKTVYGVSDAENRTGILDDEVKNIDAVLPPLVSWKTVLQDQKKKELVDTFRAQVKEHIVEIEGHYFHTDLYLARFLDARDWQMKESVELFVQAMTWRKKNDVDNAIVNFEASPYFQLLMSYWPATIMWKERNYWTYDNTPVAIDLAGKIDPLILNLVPQSVCVQFHIYCIELLERKFAMQYQKTGDISGAVMVLDLEGMSMDTMGLMDTLKEITFIDQNYYPSSLRSCLVINAPTIFSIFWTLAKSFLDERVQKKVVVYSASDRQRMQEYFKSIMPARFIPTIYGGECAAEFNPGGSCKDLGKSNSMAQGQVRKVILSRNAYYDHMVEHKPPSDPRKLLLKWEFACEDQIRFGLMYKKNAADEKEKPQQLLKFAKLKNTHKQKAVGEYVAENGGAYYLSFHNDTFLYETAVSYHFSWTETDIAAK